GLVEHAADGRCGAVLLMFGCRHRQQHPQLLQPRARRPHGRRTGGIDARGPVAAYAAMQEFTAEELPYLYLWYPDILTAKNVQLQGFPAITAATAFQFAVDWYIAR